MIEPFVAGSRGPPDFEKILREISDIEVDEEYDVEAIMGSITRRQRVLYHVKWLEYPRKKDWTFEPYENFSEAAREQLLQFHDSHPNAPRGHRLHQQNRIPPRRLWSVRADFGPSEPSEPPGCIIIAHFSPRRVSQRRSTLQLLSHFTFRPNSEA